MIAAVTHGRKGSAMMAFNRVLKPQEVEVVVDFVRQEFMMAAQQPPNLSPQAPANKAKAENTYYHTLENGWPNHTRYQAAFPFAVGEIPLDTPWESLTPAQRSGKQLFMSSCVTCHEGSRRTPLKDDPMWHPRSLSFPRNGYSHAVQGCTSAVGGRSRHPASRDTSASMHVAGCAGAAVQATARTAEGRAMQEHTAALPGRASARMPETAQQPDAVVPRVDAVTSASLYAKHDIPPKLINITAQEKQGEALFQKNCAFCHAADGTGRNWIGSFLQPPPRNLTNATAMHGMTRTRLKQVIRDGLPGTTMPAWKSVLNDSQINSVVVYVARAFHPLPE